MAKYKRKNFIKVFLPRFLISIPIVIVIFLITLSYINHLSDEKLDDNNFIYSDPRMNSLETLLEENSFDESKDMVKLLLCLYQTSVTGYFPGYTSIAYIEDEEGNIVLDSEKSFIFLFIKRDENFEETERSVYYCDYEYLTSHPEFSDLLQFEKDLYNDTFLDMIIPRTVTDCYPTVLDGYADPETHKFYIGNIKFPYCEAKVIGGTESENMLYEPFKTEYYDLTPEDVSGYLKYTYDEANLYKTLDGEKVSGFTILCGGTSDISDVTSKDTYLDNLSKAERTYTDINGDKYTVHFLVSDNFTRTYMSVLIIIALVYLFIDAGICLVISALSYSKLKGFYRNEDYRKALMSSMAHDLKTPLTVMSGYAENLKENVQTEKREHYADAILENTVYMNGIISDILGLSKLEEESAKNNGTKLDFCEIAKAQAERIKPLLEEMNITLSVEGSYLRKADKASLERVLDNLLSNAAKYTKEGGKINIYAKDKPFSKHIFVVENTPFDKIDIKAKKLWEPFVKGDQSRSEKNGTGLGLSIVKNILNNQGFRSKIKIKDGWFKVIIK